VVLLRQSAEKLQHSIDLVLASSRRVGPYDEGRDYSPEELEPYDALVGRFERVVEIALNEFFRAVELFEGGSLSETIRDRLNGMAKLSFVSDVELWMRMRDVRNRISHDYLPGQVRQIYDDIRTEFTPELERLSEMVRKYLKRLPSGPNGRRGG
jgi:nucleotidyltransferase substrate binding protein (TIGR01987 family)